jgi:mRNA interferase MazF
MAIYEPWSVVTVPFPFVDRRQVKRRPAVVLSPERFQSESQCVILAMITDARNVPWPSDVRIRDLAAAGLRFASVVRCKLFTLDRRLILSRIGMLGDADRRAAARTLRTAIVT